MKTVKCREMGGGGRAGNKAVSFTVASALRAKPIKMKCTYLA